MVAIEGIGKEEIRLEIYSVGWADQEHPKAPLEEMGQNLGSAKDPLSPAWGWGKLVMLTAVSALFPTPHPLENTEAFPPHNDLYFIHQRELCFLITTHLEVRGEAEENLANTKTISQKYFYVLKSFL